MNDTEARAGAAVIAGIVTRDVSLEWITKMYPDPGDAERVCAMLRTADLTLDWSNAPRPSTVRAVALAGSPILIPVLAVGWLAWRMRDMMISIGRMFRGWGW